MRIANKSNAQVYQHNGRPLPLLCIGYIIDNKRSSITVLEICIETRIVELVNNEALIILGFR